MCNPPRKTAAFKNQGDKNRFSVGIPPASSILAQIDAVWVVDLLAPSECFRF